MKLIIAGSRSIKSYDITMAVFDFLLMRDTPMGGGPVDPFIKAHIDEVVSGKAPGADTLGEEWANLIGIPVKPFPAPWKDKSSPTYDPRRGYDPQAGKIRNQQMADYAGGLLAIWDGKSTGTMDMVRRARDRKLRVLVVTVDYPTCCVRHKIIGNTEGVCGGKPDREVLINAD
jgi:hypothetical protein